MTPLPDGQPANADWLATRGQAGWFHRLFSFLLIGGLGALVNLVCFSGAYYLLSQSGNTSLAFFLAFIIATEVSIVCNFVLNDRFTFRHLHQFHLSWSTRCVRFHITSIGGTALTFGISFSLLHLVHVSAFLAQAIALITATAFNFTFHHIFTYRHGGRRNNHNNTRSAQIADHTVLEQIPDSYINAIPGIETRRQISMKTLIIIPTYNELENLPLLLRQIFSYAPTTDVLIVDDNSPDGTGKLAEEIRKQDSRVRVLHRPGKLGLGTAYIAGFKYAIQHGYDAAFEMDADFSHDPRFLPGFLQNIEQADLVIGSRYIPGGSTPNWSFVRRLISGSGNIFARFMLGIPVHDCTGGFRCYRRHVLENIDLDAVQSRGYAFQVEMTYRVLKRGFKIVETPITFMDRRLGKSKMSRKIVIEAFTYVLRTRFSKQFYDSPSINSPWNPEAQQDGTERHQSQQQTNFWDLRSEATGPEAGDQRFQPQSLPATPIGGNPTLPSWPQTLQEQRTSNLAVMESYNGDNKKMSYTSGNNNPQERFAIVRVEVGKEPGRVFEMQNETLSIGRLSENNIILEDPAVSRLHASILNADDGNYVLIDEGSANGTVVNGQKLNRYQRYSLQEGDEIHIGQTVLVFSR